jgi:hypothetical protein
MSVLTTFAGISGGVPPGDSINYQKTYCTVGVESTILNIAQACLVKDIIIGPVVAASNTDSNVSITTLKTNINGAGDVTKISSFDIASIATVAAPGGGSTRVYTGPLVIPCEIDASVSCSLKITFGASVSTTVGVLVRYYLK